MATSQNSGGRAIETVKYGSQKNNSRIVKIAVGLEQVSQNSYLIDLTVV